MELRKKLLSVAALAFAAALSTGIAVSATAEEETQELTGFAITHTSVRTKDFEGYPGSTGIRFKTEVPTEAAEDATLPDYAAANCYTIVTILGNVTVGEKTMENPSAKVSASEWRSTNDGWNTVVVGMPAEHYATDIQAQSFVKVSETEIYATKAVKTSVAYLASIYYADNYNGTAYSEDELEVLKNYTVGVVDSIELNATTASLKVFEAMKLTANTGEKNYRVVWSSDNEAVATVDRNGNVVAVSEGTANITATLGETKATCAVTVSGKATSVDFESGANAIVLGGDKNTTVGGVVALGDNKVVQINTGSNSIYYAFDKAFVENVFADAEVDALQWKVYADKPMVLSNHASNLTFYYVTDKGITDGVQQYGGNSLKADNASNYMTASSVGDALLVSFTRADYEVWKGREAAFFDDARTTHIDEANALIIINRLTYADAPAGAANPKKLYIDDVTAYKSAGFSKNIDFSDGIATGAIPSYNNYSTNGVGGSVSVENNVGEWGNTALKGVNTGSQSIMCVQFSRAYLDYVFVDQAATWFTFDMYMDTPAFGWARVGNGGNYYLQGYNKYSTIIGEGLKTTVNGVDYYRYTLVFPKAAYDAVLAKDANATYAEVCTSVGTVTDGTFAAKARTFCYFDNLVIPTWQDSYDLNDGRAPEMFQYGQQSAATSIFGAGMVDRGEGNFAWAIMPAATTTQKAFRINMDYLAYIFETKGYDKLSFKLDTTEVATEGVNDYVVRLVNASWSNLFDLAISSGNITCTITKEQYESKIKGQTAVGVTFYARNAEKKSIPLAKTDAVYVDNIVASMNPVEE